MGIPMEQPRAAARPPQARAQLKAHSAGSHQNRMRLQSLKNVWNDYTMSGDGVKCVCDSAAAGDPEMEGLDPNVKPACTCTGGRTTQFTGTEEGGPLDTGGHGAWPQDLPMNGGAAYVDGIVGNNAYKTRTQTLAAVRAAAMTHAEALEAYSTLVGLAETAFGGKTQLRSAALDEQEEGDADTTVVVADAARWRTLHADPKATAADRNLIEQLRRNYRSFLAETAHCDKLGDYCEGRLCRCKRRTGRHLCYKMNLIFQQDCHVSSVVKPCKDPSVTEVQDMCSVMEKLPGVNVDAWMLNLKTERGEPPLEAPTFFFAPEGVYE